MTNEPTERERERPTDKQERDRGIDSPTSRDTEKESQFNRGRETDPQRKTY